MANRKLLRNIICTIAAMVVAGYGAYRVHRRVVYERIMAENAEKIKQRTQARPFKYLVTISDTATKKYFLITPVVRFSKNNGRIVIMDFAGHIILEKNFGGGVSDFRQWKTDGHTRYSYGFDDSAVRHVTLTAGHIVILDSALNEIKQVQLLPHNNITTANKDDLDLHDFILLSDDHYIAMAVYAKCVKNIPASLSPAAGNKVATAIIQEVKDGKVIWQWDASDYPEFYENSLVGNKFGDTAAQDYMHLNSLFLDPRDSNLILSLHNLNQVVKISRKTGAILWRLGGKHSDFPLASGQSFIKQHSVALTNDMKTLLVFDNGKRKEREWSRVLEFGLDEKKKVITSFSAFRIPGPFSENQGSVQKIGVDYMICGGTGDYVMLVNSATGEKKMEIKMNQSSYRAWVVDEIDGVKQILKK